ncbi:MAG: Gfo/Idh/MocA family oxidoreductase [Thermoleophilaceae bacterium]|nr:Gfo/Idh/MocA family oxidoreductase [Thermoleophilaceae bacterium]
MRVGLIGFGLAGAAFHAPLIAAVPELRLATIATSNPERSRRARERFPQAGVVPDADALLDTADELDMAVVASPNRFHVAYGLAALEAGLHLVVDKPVAASAADARRLATAAEERGLVAAAFHNRRWDGDALTVRRLLDDGALGRLFRFESRFERWRPVVDVKRWREQPAPEDAGGLLFDLGSHLIDQALCMLGPPARVYAEIARRRPGARVDDDVFIALEYAGGVAAHLWMSHVTAQLGPRFRLLGSRAAYVKYGLDPQEAALRAGERPDTPGFGREPREGWGTLGTDAGVERVETEPGRYVAFYEGMARAVRDESPPPVPLADATRGLEVIEAARVSAERGAVVEPATG